MSKIFNFNGKEQVTISQRKEAKQISLTCEISHMANLSVTLYLQLKRLLITCTLNELWSYALFLFWYVDAKRFLLPLTKFEGYEVTYKTKGSPQMEYVPEILFTVNYYCYMEHQATKLL